LDFAGAFAQADQGTLLLDTIEKLSWAMQSKLLRALDTDQVRKIGEILPTRVNVRVIAATRRSLEQEVRDAHFQQDLYHRLAVIKLRLPPLRERLEDIRMLTEHFVSMFRGLARFELPPGAVEKYKRGGWPGNVRQLRNTVHRALLFGAAGPTRVPNMAQVVAD
jgi:two-component system, NtrC family, response regulator HydG